jgi:hypothetical protein
VNLKRIQINSRMKIRKTIMDMEEELNKDTEILKKNKFKFWK